MAAEGVQSDSVVIATNSPRSGTGKRWEIEAASDLKRGSLIDKLVGHRRTPLGRIYHPSDPWAWYAEKHEAIESWGEEIERLASKLNAQQ